MSVSSILSIFFFFNDPATSDIYTLSLHDALPILKILVFHAHAGDPLSFLIKALTRSPYCHAAILVDTPKWREDRKSTRLNSSHANISYAVFCLKKKKTNTSNRSAPPTHKYQIYSH